MRYREPFKVFKKKLSSGNCIYYYTTYDKYNKRKQFSTGKRSKHLALKYCYELFKTDELIQTNDIIFSIFTENMFIYEKCSYIQNRLTKGLQYSKTVALQNRSRLVNKIMPFFGNMKMNDIKSIHIEDWIMELKKLNLSNSTINLYLSTLKVILSEAIRLDILTETPFTHISNLKSDSKEKSVLSDEEIANLLNPENKTQIWKNDTYFLMSLIASQTGMRVGEIQALLKQNIHESYIDVKHTWDKNFGLKGTKNGIDRTVPISKDLYTLLINHNKNRKSNYLFSTKNGIPINLRTIHIAFYTALENIGISEESRKQRNVTFHSWRHYYNTLLLKKGVPLPIIQAIIGHSSKGKMTEHYTKLTKNDIINALKLLSTD